MVDANHYTTSLLVDIYAFAILDWMFVLHLFKKKN